MKSLIRCLLLLVVCIAQHAIASGVVHIANGDCAGLKAAVASAQPHGPAVDIALANRGIYGYCPFTTKGNVTVDGMGATLQIATAPDTADISVIAAASLTMRNVNLGATPEIIPPVYGSDNCGFVLTPTTCPQPERPIFDNQGTLVLDAVAMSGVDLSYGYLSSGNGDFFLRNSSIVNNSNGIQPMIPVPAAGARTEIDHSTIALNNSNYGLFYTVADTGRGTIRVSNSIFIPTYSYAPVCTFLTRNGEFVSGGGNIFGDDSCNARASNDRVVADARFLDFGTHGGVVGTLALNYDSPAIGNGVVANCEAADARGLSRGATACDSGAYEVGGGNGKLSQTGMSGLYFNAANNGHYVSIQKLYGDQSLVIWNTFDEQGVPAWLYGVGHITGNRIHVEQVAQNVGGTLHAGGGVTGSTPTLWGTLDVDLSDCYNASLSYDSLFPQFGTGSTTLQRLVFLDGVNCAR